MKSATATIAVLVLTLSGVGRVLHYGDLQAYLVFGLLAALAGITAWRFASATAVAPTPLEQFVRTFVGLFAVVVLCGLILGALGFLSIGGFVATELACLAATFFFPRVPRDKVAAAPVPLPAPVIGLVAALLAFAVGFGITHAPLTLYDSVSYHLHFAARWLQDRSISIIPTPFSDEAQAYAPANGELFFVWLMAPFHGDLLARIGQMPFAVAGCVLVYALAVRAGARPAHAVYPALFFLLSRQVLEQAVGANVDLVCATMFLASVYLGVIAIDRNRGRDWLWFGVSAGLYAGSKYLALVYSPILLLLIVMRRPSARMLWALPGVMAFASPWYLRNWISAGSPIYPASLQVAGITLAHGAFTRAAMLNTVFHTRDLGLVPVMAAHAFGPTLFFFWLPLALVGGWRTAARGWWPDGLLVAMTILMAPLYWFGLPVNIDSRFFLPALGLALLPLAFVCSERRPQWNAVVHALYAAGAVWILVGTTAAIPVKTPWFMGGWLSLDGLIAQKFLPWFAAIAVIASAAWWWCGSRRPAWAVPLTVLVCAGSATGLAFGADRWCVPARCDYLQVTSPYIRDNYQFAWYWVADHVKGATIAYTGINLPYPLTGERLANRVVYVNIDGHSRWRFHDYDRAYRAGRFAPSDPPLATSSGELLPVAARTGPRDDALRPRYERMRGIRGGWIGNLDKLGVNYLFVAALSAYEINYVWHNDGGFPIEDEWAKSDPEHFQVVYANPQVRIYAVNVAGKVRA